MQPISLERIGSLQSRLGIPRATLYRYIAKHNFPRPLKLGRGPKAAAAWVTSEVDAWVSARRCERDASIVDGPLANQSKSTLPALVSDVVAVENTAEKKPPRPKEASNDLRRARLEQTVGGA